MRFTHKLTNEKVDVWLTPGSLLLMNNFTQKYWVHEIIAGDSKSPMRISLVSRSLRKRSGESVTVTDQEFSALKNELKRVKETLTTLQKERSELRQEIRRLEQRWQRHEEECRIREAKRSEARQDQLRYLREEY